jgi:enamine deaminase RidA (YjgF/YER057c/UK114 family)
MDVSRYCPKGVFDTTPMGFPQVLIAAPGKLLFANSVSLDENMTLVGENDFEAQMRFALHNLNVILESAGATPGEILQMRVNVVGMTDTSRIAVIKTLNEFYGDYPRGSNALIGIDRLARPQLLVEIEIIAGLE